MVHVDSVVGQYPVVFQSPLGIAQLEVDHPSLHLRLARRPRGCLSRQTEEGDIIIGGGALHRAVVVCAIYRRRRRHLGDTHPGDGVVGQGTVLGEVLGTLLMHIHLKRTFILQKTR